jgi:hemerythrin-like domain-containing protein
MDALMADHRQGRVTTQRLVSANERHKRGEGEALSIIVECMQWLVEFYPKHIEREDKHFFMPVMAYFTKDEKDALLKEGYAFDSELLHRVYQEKVAEAERRAAADPF